MMNKRVIVKENQGTAVVGDNNNIEVNSGIVVQRISGENHTILGTVNTGAIVNIGKSDKEKQ